MSYTLFFPKTVHRQVRIRSFQGLVGKAPEKQKRIKIMLSMPLSGLPAVGMPGWLADAWEFVEKTHDLVSQSITFPGVNLQFSADDMFSKPAKAPKSSLNKFSIVSVGDKEEPDTELQFVAYAPFSTALLNYVGQFAGDDIWANFDLIGEADTSSRAAASADDADDEDAEEEDDERTGETDSERELFGKDSEYMGKEHDALFASPGPPKKEKAAKPEKASKAKPPAKPRKASGPALVN